jgi:GSH-dependent disulfide-bond oxidoreductase
MDNRLSEVEYFIDNDCSIVDMAIYPWVASYERQGQRIEDYPNRARWYEEIGGRCDGRWRWERSCAVR